MQTVFNTKIHKVMKNYSKYICAFVLLLGMSANAWGKVLNFDFSSAITGWPTSEGSGANKTYTLEGTDYTFTLGNNVYCASTSTYNYLMLKYITSLGLPAISGYKLVCVRLTTSSGGSTATKVAVCSNTSGTTVTGGDTQTLDEQGGTFDYYLSGTSANTMYYLYVTNKNCQLTNIKLIYESTSDKFTVSFDPGNGTYTGGDKTEGTVGGGITLPTATPSSDAADAGWSFAGWSYESCTERTTEPILLIAGNTYYPYKNETLHAVYSKDLVATTDYTIIERGAEFVSGEKYVISAYSGGYNYALTATVQSSYYLARTSVSPSDDDVISNPGSAIIWTISAESSLPTISLKNGDNYAYVYNDTYHNLGLTTTKNTFTIGEERLEDFISTFYFKSTKYTSYYIEHDNSRFETNTASRENICLYKRVYTGRYNSNPCVNIVTLSDGTKTNVSSIALSSNNIETCSSTAADRQVIVTVTTNTGYKMVGDLGFAKTGTVTATKNSGPTGSGPYTYVYEFNQNDNGTGTFSATATPKTYTITLDSEGGSDGSANVVLTYASSSHDAITNPTKTGYTFAGWYSGDDGTGELVINTSGELQNSVTVSTVPWTDASGNWKKDGTVTLHAKWNINKYKVTLASPTTVAISATSPSIAEGAYAEVNYNSTVTLTYSSLEGGRQWLGWKVTKDADGSNVTASVVSTNTLTVPAYDVTVNAEVYGGFAFSCAELTLTPHLATTGTPIFITSTASKTVRSQDYIEITGNGLTPSTALTFPGLPSKFAIKNADGTALATESDGTITANAFIFYTPDAEDTSDGLDKLTGISVSVGGAKPITKNLTQEIFGRHLPADFVIAVKRNNKWLALPATMDELTNPSPVEIAVDDKDNPDLAYTASTNIYNLYGQNSGGGGKLYTDGQTVKLGMKNNSNKPLFGSSTGTSTVKGDGSATVTNNIGSQYWWTLTQTGTSITNPQDAKYSITCSNNTAPFVLKENAGNPQWGFFTTGSVGAIRLIPASDIAFTEAEVVEWGQHGAILEVDAAGIDATSVIAHLGEENSSAITLEQTGTSVKGSATKYNYTVNFGDGIDFADAASSGALLTLEWKKGETVKAMSNVIVPKIVASNITANSTNYPTKSVWDTEVHVLPGDTLTIDASGYDKKVITISELNIYPGATVKIVGSADTLNVRSLVLRNGWTRVGSKRYDVARLFVGTASYLKKANNKDGWYSDWYIDYDQYYPIAVPFPVATSNIIYKNTKSAASAGVKLRYYSGELRATNIQQNQAANWVEYTWAGTMPTNLEPSHGYIMTAKRPTGKAFSIVRMPLTFSNDWTALGEKGEVGGTHKDQVAVRAWDTGSTPEYAKGWNIIANPYMSLHQGALSYNDASGDMIEYANIPDIDFKEYDQLPILTTKLKPSSAFLVQAPKDGTVTFGTASRKASAPSYRRDVQAETLPTQRAYIVLANNEAEDMMGILVSDKYSAEYELNADLEKLMSEGKSLRTYMHWGEMNMAYLAINKELAQQWIPVSVRIETEGEHTFSMHSASIVGELKAVYLTDYQTGMLTNLLEDSYSFYSAAGTIHDRFAINAVVGPRDIPTELDVVYDGNEGTGPIKFIYHDKVFILHEGVIYDSTGKKVSGK